MTLQFISFPFIILISTKICFLVFSHLFCFLSFYLRTKFVSGALWCPLSEGSTKLPSMFIITHAYIGAEFLHHFINLMSMQYNFYPKGNSRVLSTKLNHQSGCMWILVATKVMLQYRYYIIWAYIVTDQRKITSRHFRHTCGKGKYSVEVKQWKYFRPDP